MCKVYSIFQKKMLLPVFLVMTIVSSVRLLNPNPLVNIVVSQEDLDALNKESHKLVTKKTEKAALGEPFELSCSLRNIGDIELCSWSRDGGAEMFVQNGELLDHRRRQIEGITANSADSRYSLVIL